MGWLTTMLETIFEPSSVMERYRNPDVAGLKAECRVEGLLRVLRRRQCYPWVRRNAAQALGELGNASAVPHLMAIVRDEGENIELRAAATEALATLGNRDAMDVLVSVLRSGVDSNAEAEIVTSLGRSADPVFAKVSLLSKRTHRDFLHLVIRNMRQRDLSLRDTRRYAEIMFLLCEKQTRTDIETYTEEECWDIGNPWGSWVAVEKTRENTTEWLEVVPDGENRAYTLVEKFQHSSDAEWNALLASLDRANIVPTIDILARQNP